jgi:hypothetical protein
LKDGEKHVICSVYMEEMLEEKIGRILLHTIRLSGERGKGLTRRILRETG